jgi:hypothetical protein
LIDTQGMAFIVQTINGASWKFCRFRFQGGC